LSSLKGRDSSCLKKIVIITALSGVGVALSVGVCAPLSELNIAAEASTASAVNSVLVRPIVIPLLRTSACSFEIADGDHRRQKNARKRRNHRVWYSPEMCRRSSQRRDHGGSSRKAGATLR